MINILNKNKKDDDFEIVALIPPTRYIKGKEYQAKNTFYKKVRPVNIDSYIAGSVAFGATIAVLLIIIL